MSGEQIEKLIKAVEDVRLELVSQRLAFASLTQRMDEMPKMPEPQFLESIAPFERSKADALFDATVELMCAAVNKVGNGITMGEVHVNNIIAKVHEAYDKTRHFK